MTLDANPTRIKVHDAISKTPGIHFREIMRVCAVSTGQLSHHLSSLKKLGLIREEKQGRNSRFYPLGLNENERALLGILRNPTARRIIMSLLEKSPKSHKSICASVNLSQSTISWHLEQLKETGVVLMHKKGKEHHYFLANPAEVAKTIISHRQSFLDKMVENFIESWEK
jgi:predicted transcriptional regulator